jgi:hypothetical protein
MGAEPIHGSVAGVTEQNSRAARASVHNHFGDSFEEHFQERIQSFESTSLKNNLTLIRSELRLKTRDADDFIKPKSKPKETIFTIEKIVP